MTENRWIDEVWWRDWILWVAVLAATIVMAVTDVSQDVSWWRQVWTWACTCGLTVAVLGFVRTVVRTYRAE